MVAVMVAWPLPGDIWAQAAVSPEHAPSEHRAHQQRAHRCHQELPAVQCTTTNIDSANSDPQQGPHKYFQQGKYIFESAKYFFVTTKYFL